MACRLPQQVLNIAWPSHLNLLLSFHKCNPLHLPYPALVIATKKTSQFSSNHTCSKYRLCEHKSSSIGLFPHNVGVNLAILYKLKCNDFSLTSNVKCSNLRSNFDYSDKTYKNLMLVPCLHIVFEKF